MKIGDTHKTIITYTQEDVEKFAELSGDNNPLHLDDEYAAKTIFKKPIIHGFLSASIFSKILGVEFPGEGTIYLKQTLNFLKPMFVDTNYEAILTVSEIDSKKHRALIKTNITNQRNGKKVLAGEALIQNENVL